MTRVIIVGGGVAGAATALALQGAGVGTTVYEAHGSGGEDAGAFLTVMENGMGALDRVGAAEAVISASYPARTVGLVGADGAELGQRPIEGRARTITRAALYRVLQGLLVERGIPIVHGKRLTAQTGQPRRKGGAGLVFADGSTVEADVVVGADGIHSVTRRLIDPGAPEPRYTGQHVVYGYAEGNPAGAGEEGYRMVRGAMTSGGFTVPGDGRTWWFVRLGGERREGDTSPEQWRDLVLEAVREDAGPMAALVAATDIDQIVGADSFDVPTTPRWHDARMVLTGDAAHAASPAAAQGASMALKDAVALAEAVRDHTVPEGVDWERAFDAYEIKRRAETEETVAAGAQLNERLRQPRG
jgi:2-polyprenyl-6-methoxyphenol hydroxylase-like FAD-dependent oxidoreductase